MRLAAQGEDPPVALLQQRDGARRRAVGDEAAAAQSLEPSTADHARQRDARRARREAEVAEQRDQAAGPDEPVVRHQIGAEEGHHEVLRLGLEAVGPHGAKRYLTADRSQA